jgi:septum formation protein
MRKIVLASTSPRRKQLLKLTTLKFAVDPGDYEEDMSLKLPPRKLVKLLAQGKAEAVAKRHKNAIVIAGDTFVVFRNKHLGKPKSPAEARKMLRMLSGKTNSVVSALAVIDTKSGKKFTSVCEIKVTFRKMPPSEIDAYVRSGEPMDKAGAYAVQSIGSLFVKRIEGDYSGLVGMSLVDLGRILKKLGVKIY